MTNLILEKKQVKINSLNTLLKDEIYFEFDDEVWEYCCFFKRIDWYFWQWRTQNEAFVELISAYLDTSKLKINFNN